MLPAMMGAMGAGGGGGIPGLSDQSSAAASGTVSQAGMSIGGGGRKLDSPAFLRAKLGGSVEALPAVSQYLLLGSAALLVIVLLKKG